MCECMTLYDLNINHFVKSVQNYFPLKTVMLMNIVEPAINGEGIWDDWVLYIPDLLKLFSTLALDLRNCILSVFDEKNIRGSLHFLLISSIFPGHEHMSETSFHSTEPALTKKCLSSGNYRYRHLDWATACLLCLLSTFMVTQMRLLEHICAMLWKSTRQGFEHSNFRNCLCWKSRRLALYIFGTSI